jgi:hypothetical protein
MPAITLDSATANNLNLLEIHAIPMHNPSHRSPIKDGGIRSISGCHEAIRFCCSSGHRGRERALCRGAGSSQTAGLILPKANLLGSIHKHFDDIDRAVEILGAYALTLLHNHIRRTRQLEQVTPVPSFRHWFANLEDSSPRKRETCDRGNPDDLPVHGECASGGKGRGET